MSKAGRKEASFIDLKTVCLSIKMRKTKKGFLVGQRFTVLLLEKRLVYIPSTK